MAKITSMTIPRRMTAFLCCFIFPFLAFGEDMKLSARLTTVSAQVSSAQGKEATADQKNADAVYSTTSNPARATTFRTTGPRAYLAGLALSPPCVADNGSTSGIVTLSYPSTTDTRVTLSSSFAGVKVPPSVTIPSGKIAAPFTITGVPDSVVDYGGSAQYVTIRADAGVWTQGAIVTLYPHILSLAVQDLTLQGGNSCVVLTWNPTTNIPMNAFKAYHVYRRLPGNDANAKELTSNYLYWQATSFADTNLPSSSSAYEYRVSVETWTGVQTYTDWMICQAVPSAPAIQLVNPVTLTSGLLSVATNFGEVRPSGSTCQKLIIDGKDYGPVSTDEMLTPETYVASVDTTEMADGSHTIQIVGSGDIACATSPTSFSVSNGIGNVGFPAFFQPASGDLTLVHATAAKAMSRWSVTITSDDSGAVVLTRSGDSGSSFTVAWDGTDASGASVAPGTYTVTIIATDGQNNQKMTKKKIMPTTR